MSLGIIEEIFDAGQHVGSPFIELLRQLQGGRQGVCGRCQRMDQAQGVELRRRYTLAQHQQAGDHGARQGARKRPAAAAIGRQADGAVRHDEHSVLGRHHEIAGQRQRKTGACSSAFHRSDHRFGKGPDRVNPAVQGLDTLRLNFCRFLPVGLQSQQVSACAKCAAFSGDDNAADFGVVFGRVQRFYTSGIDFGAQCISVLRVAERQDQRAAFAGAFQGACHLSFPLAADSDRWHRDDAARVKAGSEDPHKRFAY